MIDGRMFENLFHAVGIGISLTIESFTWIKLGETLPQQCSSFLRSKFICSLQHTFNVLFDCLIPLWCEFLHSDHYNRNSL